MRNLAAKPAPPADPRFCSFYDFAYEGYRAKYGQVPSWGGKDRKTLQRFLKDQPQIASDEFQRRYSNFLDSTDHYFRQQGGSLAFFVSRFDAFRDGPLLAHGPPRGATASGRTASVQAEPGKYEKLEVRKVKVTNV
jgi:hypothetical protein